MDIFLDLLCACNGKRCIVFSNLQNPNLTLIALFQLFFRYCRYNDEDERDVSSSSGDIPRQLDTVAGSCSLIMWLDAYGAAVENVNGWSRRWFAQVGGRGRAHQRQKAHPRGSHGGWSVASSVAWADYSDIQEFAFWKSPKRGIANTSCNPLQCCVCHVYTPHPPNNDVILCMHNVHPYTVSRAWAFNYCYEFAEIFSNQLVQ